MLDDHEFSELMHKTRAGDECAAEQLVKLYEPEIRRAARLRMTDPQMRRLVDSMDICQSVFGRFFKNATEGAFEMKSPHQLLALLVTMTRNRVIDEHRKNTSQKRSSDPNAILVDSSGLVDQSSGPQTKTALNELIQEARSLLTAEELLLADQRNGGASWDEIAADVGETTDGVRKRHERAMNRVRAQLDSEAQ